VQTTTEVVRIMEGLVRRADSGLVRSAVRNAATSMHAARSREIDDARTLHDLQKIPAAAASPTRSDRPGHRAAR
jgi:hypothetical protein